MVRHVGGAELAVAATTIEQRGAGVLGVDGDVATVVVGAQAERDADDGGVGEV